MDLVRFRLALVLVLISSLTCHAKEKDGTVSCVKLKTEIRTKYNLPAKTNDLRELEDTRGLVKQLESMLEKKRKGKESAGVQESAEQAMNRRMEIANLEYEIDNLSDFIPEIKAKKDKLRNEQKSKLEDINDAPHYSKAGRKAIDLIDIHQRLIEEKHGKYYTK